MAGSLWPQAHQPLGKKTFKLLMASHTLDNRWSEGLYIYTYLSFLGKQLGMFRKTGAPVLLGETRSFWATASYQVYKQGEGQTSFAYEFDCTTRERRKATAAWVYETKQRKSQDASRVGDCNHTSLLSHHKNTHFVPIFACYGSSTCARLHVVRVQLVLPAHAGRHTLQTSSFTS